MCGSVRCQKWRSFILHRQLSDEQLVAAGINGGMIRLSVGLENVEDIIDDLKQGFAAI